MIVLGGWLFADLLLGLAMLFFTANTVGQPRPTPTPTATPNLLATSEAELAVVQSEADALATQVSNEQLAAQSTADAVATAEAVRRRDATATAAAIATRSAMTEAERATADAQATQDAVAAEATIAAFATQQTQSDEDIDALAREQATAAAQATQDALAAEQTIAAQATEQAMVSGIATENAVSGANALATANAQATEIAEIAAVATQNALSGANDLATAAAAATAAQATIDALAASDQQSDAELATAQARLDVINSSIAALQATATVLADVAANSGVRSSPVTVSISVNASGILAGNDNAEQQAVQQLADGLTPFRDAGCRVGFVITEGSAPDIGTGNSIADAVNTLIRAEFPDLVDPEATGFYSFANVGPPTGPVNLLIFPNSGCDVT